MIKSFESKEQFCQSFVGFLFMLIKIQKILIVDDQKVFIDIFKTEDEFERCNEKFAIAKNIVIESNHLIYKIFIFLKSDCAH